ISLVHSRFSTNTFPTWNLAQPFRLLGHNGEINTIHGNRIWMTARESVLKSDKLGNLKDLFPIVQPDMSDSASLDNVFEFLMMAGLSLPHALSMLVPESWNEKNPISEDLKAFYEYHSMFMEPWDGPADLMFTDGRYAGGMLDRNGLRPARYLITNDDLLVMASETGVLKFKASDIREKGRLRPGKMFLIDTEKGEIHYDAEIKDSLAKAYPYREWLNKNRIDLATVSSGRTAEISLPNYKAMVTEFGYTKEDIDFLITSMALEGKEPVNSMGNDTPLAVISDKPQRLFAYFRQLFAQVTNPPIDPIREELVMSMTNYVGSIHTNLLEPAPEICKMVKIKNPILTNIQFDLLLNLNYKGFSTTVLPMLFDPQYGAEGLEKAVDELCKSAEKAVDAGKNYIVLSDRGVDAQHAAIPSLLAVSAVHHYLVEKRKRMQTAIVVETAEPREVMHFALLFGYGANIVNPYMAFAVLQEEIKKGNISLDYESAQNHYIKSVTKGIMKIMSKMGIATIRSYRGAQIFEAVGIGSYVLDKYFKGTNSKIGGIDMSDIYRDIADAHKKAFAPDLEETWTVTNAGNYAFRKDGELHAWNPETISKLQLATRSGDYAKFKEFTKAVDEKVHPMWLRDFMDYKRNPIDISEVEP
ncbi:MAG: glutamate synthase subunit alpha, partial [Bacteroidales bacterium]|nr:glutamate synthase subunit alpha [Bacteroidales bacterium]